ncbi:MAG: DUF3482 domain-containing protein, partial [Verrucomicrobiota bacterium]
RIEHVVAAMDTEWDERREDATEALMDFLEQSLTLRTTDAIEERDESIPSRRERKEAALAEEYFGKLAKLEAKCVEKLLQTYRHHLIEVDVDVSRHRGLDLATDETWRKWGLNRLQLTAAGALAGGAAGAVFDLGVGVHSLGAGTVIGALGGGTAAFFKGGQLPELKVKLGGGLKLKGGDGKAIVIGPPASLNFPWVLLDSMLLRYRGILERAHGRRDDGELDPGEGESLVRQFPSDRRSLLQKWFNSCLKGSPDRSREAEVFSALMESLEEVEGS